MDPYNTADAHRAAAPLPPAIPPAFPPPGPSNPYAAPTARVAQADYGVETVLSARWMRLVAVLLDTAIVLVPTLMVQSVAAAAVRPHSSPSAGVTALLGLYVLGLAVYVLVQLVMIHRSGQTMGKRLMGIRIVRADGSRAGLRRIFLLRSLVPNLIGAIPFLGLFFVLIDALFIFAEDRRCLHDRFADTVVVDA